MRSNKETRVVLKSFLGRIKPKRNTARNENYWMLIGEKGTIIEEEGLPNMVLVLFDCNLDDLQLENHNPIKNSLWIRKTDLEFLNE